MTIQPNSRGIVALDLVMCLPKGTRGDIRSRSGISKDFGVEVSWLNKKISDIQSFLSGWSWTGG